MVGDCGAETTALRVIQFFLQKPTPLLNTIMDQHWSKRRKRNRTTAWEVRVALGAQRVEQPFRRARVTIERRSVGVPDVDGMVGGAKSLIDALLPASDTHPCGLGLIADDGPFCMDLVVRAVRVIKHSDQGTLVSIEEMSCS